MKRLPWIALFPSLFLVGQIAAQDTPKPSGASSEVIEVPDAVKGITARELGGHMKFLASDLMRGRDTASPEIRLAAEYIASRLSAAGAEPSGDTELGRKGYFQRFPLEVVTALQDGTSVTLEIEQNGSKQVIPLQLGSDVTFTPSSGITPGEFDAPVVFAGYGRSNPTEKVDDYDGLDVKNRFVLVLAGQAPPKPKEEAKEAEKKTDETAKAPEKAADQPKTKARNRPGMGSGNGGKLTEALKRGALGVIVVRPTTTPATRPAPAPVAGRPLPGFGRPSMTLGSPPSSIPMFTLADPIRDLLFQAGGIDPAKPDTHMALDWGPGQVHLRREEGAEGGSQRHRFLPRYRSREEEGSRHLQRPLRPRRRRRER